MVATTVAAVRGDPRSTAPAIASWHAFGLVIGAAALAIVVSLVGEATADLVQAIGPLIGVAIVATGIASALGVAVSVISSPAQVPKAWSTTMSPAQHSFAYGVGLGLGVLTRIPTWSLHVLVILLLLAGDVRIGLVAAMLYAAGRALPVVVALARGEDTEIVVDGVERLRPLAFRIDGLVLVVAGLVVLANAV
jgi:hypothetical protein